MKANQILLRTLSLSLPIALGLGGATSSAYAYDQPASRIERAPPIDRRPSRSDHPVVGRPVDRNRDGFVAKRDLLASRRLEALADARRIDFNRDGWPPEPRRAPSSGPIQRRFNVDEVAKDLVGEELIERRSVEPTVLLRRQAGRWRESEKGKERPQPKWDGLFATASGYLDEVEPLGARASQSTPTSLPHEAMLVSSQTGGKSAGALATGPYSDV